MEKIIKELKIEEMPHPGTANTSAHMPEKSAERYPPHYSNLEHQGKEIQEEFILKKDSSKEEDK